jgi:hypothetical protein
VDGFRLSDAQLTVARSADVLAASAANERIKPLRDTYRSARPA